ncbi:neuraminidase-like domain-containing protein [Nocardia sp. NPDC060256]|uniref:Tc toxin subunit A-related protein n=1 Tax=unclassified Nocardia TaxID=2637762 RepID=UPI003657A049
MTANEVVTQRSSVVGRVTDPDGNPVAGAAVTVVERRLRSETVLGESITEADGRYQVELTATVTPTALIVQLAVDGAPTLETVRTRVRDKTTVDLQVPTRRGGEYGSVLARVAPLLDGAALRDLEAADIAHLAQATGQDEHSIAHLVTATRLAADTGLPADMFYGALRQGFPAQLGRHSPLDVEAAIVAAAAAGIIETAEGAGDFATAIRAQHVSAAVRSDGATSTEPMSVVLAAVVPDQAARERAYAAYLNRPADLAAWWDELAEDTVAGAYVERLGLAFELHTLTDGNMALVRALLARFDDGEYSDPRELVRSSDVWAELIEQTGGVPERSKLARNGSTPAADHVSNYARDLHRRTVERYPTAHIAHELSTRSGYAQTPSARFLADNPEFDIVGTPVTASTVPDAQARPELAEIQRTFKIARDFDTMQALRDNGFDSAQAVATLGRDMFARKVSEVLDPDTARAVHDRATLVNAAATNLVADFRTAGHFDVPWLPSLADPGLLPATHPIPDWEELFGPADYGTFTPSRSIYGQPAYLVDLLYFLRRLGGGNATDEGPVAKALYARRPDLWDVELDDDNTDLSLPYVDLVNELLESAVVPEAPIPAKQRQSSGDRATLRIQPQQVNPAAYAKLRAAVYPFDLPFDLFREQTDAYLAHAGVSRVTLLETLGAAPDSPTLLVDERLGLNTVAARIIAGEPLTPARTLAEYYGMAPATDLVGVLRNVRVLLDACSLRYEELTQLLDTRFVNPGGVLSIKAHPDYPYETPRMTLVGLDTTALDRLHRFVRLQRALGWSAQQVDQAIHGCNSQGELDRQTLRTLAAVRKLAARLSLSVEQVLTFFNTVDTHVYRRDGGAPLYDRLFLDPAVVAIQPGAANPFALRADRTELAVLGSLTTPSITAALLAVLQMTDDDLAALTTGPRAVTPDRMLNLANLSTLVRTSTLARALYLTIPDLLRLIELIGGGGPFPALAGVFPAAVPNAEVAGGDPMLPTVGTALPAYPAGAEGEVAGGALVQAPSLLDSAPPPPVYAQTVVTEQFLDAVDAIRNAGLTIPEVDAVLTATMPAQGGVVPDDIELAATLTALRAGLQAVYQQTAQTLDERGELTRKQLTLLGWDPALAQEAVATLLGTVTYTAKLTALPENAVLPPKIPVRFSAANQQLLFTGPMTEDQKTSLLKVSTAVEYQAAVDELYWAPRLFVAARMKARRIPVFAADQPTMPADYQMPKTLSGKVFYDVNDHKLKSRGYLSQADAEALTAAPSGSAIAAAVAELRRVQEVADIPDENKFLDLEVAKTFFRDAATVPADRFRVVLGILNPLLRRTLSEITIKQQLGQAADLNPATADLLLGTWLRSSSGSVVLAEFLAPAFVSSDAAVPVTRSAFGQQFSTLSRIHRVALLLARLRVDAVELPFVFGYAGKAGWLNLNELPSAPIVGPAPLFAKFVRLLDLIRVRAGIPGGIDTFDTVFAVAADPSSGVADVVKELAARTSWNAADLGILAPLLGLTAAARFLDVAALRAVGASVRLLLRLGVTADRLGLWTHAELTPAAAEAAWQAAKAKHALADWSVVAAPMQDAIRDRQRAALVSYLVANPLLATDRIVVPEWTDTNGLHDYFLLDVEMGASQLTTRMAQAIYSVQLFVQRCLLNLEPLVNTADTSLWEQWEWMKQYRLWEANQKVFLYPENYFEPDLRPDKTAFFTDMENEIMQKEVTEENVGTTAHHYLEKLYEVARLHPCGLYRDKDTSTIYVFARSDSTPRFYYFRTWVNRTYWTAWQKIDLDIGSETLVPVIWNKQLYLFWATFTLANDPQEIHHLPDDNNAMKPAPQYWNIKLEWSRLNADGWQAKKISESAIATKPFLPSPRYDINIPSEFDPIKSQKYRFLPEFADNGDLLIHATYNNSISVTDTMPPAGTPAPQRYSAVARGTFRLSARSGRLVVEPLTAILFPASEGAPLQYFIDPPVDMVTFNNEFDGSSTMMWGDDREGEGLPAELTMVLRRIPSPPLRVLFSHRPQNDWAGFFMFVSDGIRSFVFEVTNATPHSHPWMRAKSFYHPYVEQLMEQLSIGGFNALVSRNVQLQSGRASGKFKFEDVYGVETRVIGGEYPDEDMDFSGTGPYAQYNWELFFHTPLLLAERLTTNQKFADAQKWFHLIFDPTDRSGLSAPQRFWRTKPFFQTAGDPTEPGSDYYKQRIEEILKRLAAGNIEEQRNVEVWLSHPFQPDIVARLRSTAYQKAVVMKYLDNLIAWGDQLFQQDTGESINQAAQLYILAAELLGRRPEAVFDSTPAAPLSFRTMATTKPVASNPAVVAEHLVAVVEDRPTASVSPGITVGAGSAWLDYFRVPRNEKLLAYWDIVEDRLTKIRTGRTLTGGTRQLAAFGSVIDPMVLVRAAASGADLSTVLDDVSAPLPHYRFGPMLAKSKELAAEVESFGAALLAALEKRDVEALARLRSSHEKAMLDAVKTVKAQQVTEASDALEAARKARAIAQGKLDYYASRDFMNGWEITHTVMAGLGLLVQGVSGGIRIAAGATSHIPEAKIGFVTTVGVTYGGSNVSKSLENLAGALDIISGVLHGGGELAATIGGYRRRADDWDFQASQAQAEIEHADQQIAAATAHLGIAQSERDNHDLQIRQAGEVDQFLTGKFTNRELYDWMIGRLATSFFQAYQLAYDVAKRAERSYRHELGIEDSGFINFGYWDSLHKGLLSGERLMADLNRMDAAYLEANAREFEMTKRISLAQLDAKALLSLKETGSCYVSVPEALFDLDAPGQYFRRIKNVSITVPCVAGPYTGVNLTATLTGSSVRIDSRLSDGTYRRKQDQPDHDTRFRDYTGPIESIVTSTGQDDAGLFETNLHDERFLPFEGMGAISQWKLSLPSEFRQFDYETITDVVLHLRYTARDGGSTLGDAAVAEMKAALDFWVRGGGGKGLLRVFSARREFADQWQKFLATPAGGTATATFRLSKSKFPQLFRDHRYTVGNPELVLVLSQELGPDGKKRFVDYYTDEGGATLKATLNVGSTNPPTAELGADPTLGGLPRTSYSTIKDVEVRDAGQDWIVTAPITGLHPNLLTTDRRLNPDAVLDLLLVCPYSVKEN